MRPVGSLWLLPVKGPHAVPQELRYRRDTARPAGPVAARRRGRGLRGFTLIELLLVLVILGVLAAVVVPKFTRRSEQARITAAKTDLSNLEVALDAFEIDNGRYPTSQEGLDALTQAPGDMGTTWQGPYLKRSAPADPWGRPYVYRSPGQFNPDGFDLYSFGPNGQEGDADDITNWTR